MCIKQFFMRFRKVAEPQKQESEQVKTNHRIRAVGQYLPRTDYVRIDNIGYAAGVSENVVVEAAKETGATICKLPEKRGRYVSKPDAIDIHTYICKNK